MHGEHPQKVLQDAVEMYQSRLMIAIEQKAKYRNAGMFVVMNESPRIVPDMRVLCLDREQLLGRLDPAHASVGGAVAMFDRVDEGSAVFGVLFADGGVMATVLQVRKVDRPA